MFCLTMSVVFLLFATSEQMPLEDISTPTEIKDNHNEETKILKLIIDYLSIMLKKNSNIDSETSMYDDRQYLLLVLKILVEATII